MMMPILLAFLLGLALNAGPERPGPFVQPDCPPADSSHLSRIRTLISIPEFQAMADVGTASTADVRAVTDPAVCRSLRSAVEAERAPQGLNGAAMRFYRSGDRYFVPVDRPPPATGVRLDGGSAVEMYDSAFRLLERVMI